MGLFNRKKSATGGSASGGKAAEEQATQTPALAVPKGESARAYGVLVGPHVAEKAATGNQHGVYTFRVAEAANKIAIRESVEKLYQVSVARVRVLRMPAKQRQVGRHRGTRAGFKKAMVTLKAGQQIDVA